jgi:hypothetical protein
MEPTTTNGLAIKKIAKEPTQEKERQFEPADAIAPPTGQTSDRHVQVPTWVRPVKHAR